MKKIKYLSLAVATACLASCSLDEENYSNVDTNVAYSTVEGYQGIVDACYENLYYLYGKLDGIAPMEMGTDLWEIGSLNGNNGDLTNYNNNLTPSTGVLKTVWNALYGIVGYTNTAIYFQGQGNFSPDEVKGAAAEARFLRAFANFHIVEQWGGVVLDTVSFAQSGVPAEYAYRASEHDFYKLIISDLTKAVEDLPVINADRGRATKKSALAMLAKAYMQSTRLYAPGSQEYKNAVDSAYAVATRLIDNAAQYDCGLYASTATKSGNAQVWDGDNNKDNKEYLFLEAIDHIDGKNPEWWNRGRTSQYYMMKISSQAQNFGVASSGLRYGRDNATSWSPTLYLLQECFEPKLPKAETSSVLVNLALNPNDRTADTRFEDAFNYKYYAMAQTIVSKKMLTQYRKDADSFKKVADRTVKSAKMSGVEMEQKYPGLNYYAGGTLSGEYFEVEGNVDAIGCYTPNWDLDTTKTKLDKRLAVGPNDYFNNNKLDEDYGGEPEFTFFRGLFPSLKKHRMFKYVQSNQTCMMDMPIIRLTDIYLLAAEASILKGTPEEGLKYLNAVRRHAAVSGDAAEMEVGVESMTIDYILKERARELCGEQWRWYDLKRTGRLNKAYLTQKGMNPYMNINDEKHYVRPVPQQFLDQIANPEEFGTNGY